MWFCITLMFDWHTNILMFVNLSCLKPGLVSHSPWAQSCSPPGLDHKLKRLSLFSLMVEKIKRIFCDTRKVDEIQMSRPINAFLEHSQAHTFTYFPGLFLCYNYVELRSCDFCGGSMAYKVQDIYYLVFYRKKFTNSSSVAFTRAGTIWVSEFFNEIPKH